MSPAVRVLYMEDDAGAARLLQKRLQRAGYEVDVAPNGEAGLEQFSASVYDVIIIDHNMPGMTGLQVMRELSNRESMPTTVMLTGTGSEKTAVEAMKLGAADYLVKDIDGGYIELLPIVIAQSLKQRQLMDDKRRAEEALERSEKYHRALTENSLDMVLVADADAVLRYVSPSIRTVFGIDEQALIGRNGMDFLRSEGAAFPESLDVGRRFLQSLLDKPGERLEVELCVPGEDGEPQWLELRGRNLLHESWVNGIVLNIRTITKRKKAEEALRESEKRFRMLVEQSLDGIVLVDQEGKIVEWNRAQEQITGVRRQDAIGQDVWDISYKTAIPANRTEALHQRLREGFIHMIDHPQETPWLGRQIEFEIERSDGSRRTIQSVKFLIDAGGRVLIGDVTRDITEHQQAEQALRESEARFRMLFKEAPEAFFIADINGNLLDCNRAVELLIGLSQSELMARPFSEWNIFPPDRLARIREVLGAIQAREEVDWFELSFSRPDNQEVVVELRIIPIDYQGETRLLGIAHDITWRKQAEAQLTSHIGELEILHWIDDELSQKLNMDYVQTMALEKLMQMSGAAAGCIALIESNSVRIVKSAGYPEEAHRLFSLEERSILTRVARTREAEWVQDVSTDSDYLAVRSDTRSQITIPLMSQERLIGVITQETPQPETFTAEKFEFLKLISARVAIAIDNAQLYVSAENRLVELQDLYTQLSKLEQLKTDMIRIAAHDLRNPLAIVSGYIGILRKSLGDQLGEKQLRYIEHIEEAAKQMKAITTDFLSLDRIEELTHNVGQTVNLSELVQGVSANYRIQAEQKTQVFRVFLPEKPIVVRGFKMELQQAIANIVGNAIKYTPKSGNIQISLLRMDKTANFEVTDTGYGVPEDQQARLFQAFYRVKSEETQSIDGTGLGLYIVKRIVERHGGQVLFHSVPGQGSTFGFEVPLSEM